MLILVYFNKFIKEMGLLDINYVRIFTCQFSN